MIAGKFILSSEVCEQLTTGDVVHQEEQIPRILCESSKANLKISVSQITYKEGMINVSENSVLTNYMICLFISNDVGFLESLHGVIFTGLFVFAEHYSTKRTSTQGSREVIILEINRLFRCHYYY